MMMQGGHVRESIEQYGSAMQSSTPIKESQYQGSLEVARKYQLLEVEQGDCREL
jgi:hypothetical protein